MPGYDYHGLMASTWDVWRDDTAGWQDRSFYASIVGQGDGIYCVLGER